MTWKEAVLTVLKDNKKGDIYVPMHYRDITNAIFENDLIKSEGKKTPANTVNATLTSNKDLFENVGDGEYKLTERGLQYSAKHKKKGVDIVASDKESDESQKSIVQSKLIKSYGMYWMRDAINWNTSPRLLGVQTFGSKPIDLSEMRGIYMLYDGREVVYVGQATDSILKRLIQHTKNRLATRWNRFSWFGIDDVNKDGQLIKTKDHFTTNINDLVDALEGILIEGLEPRQNRRQGDNFGFEYYQQIDKEITKSRIMSDLKTLF